MGIVILWILIKLNAPWWIYVLYAVGILIKAEHISKLYGRY